MTWTEFRKSGKKSPVYLITGDEDLLKEKAVELIAGKDTKLKLGGDEISVEQLMDELYTLDMMGGHKTVVLVDENNFVKQNLETIESYCAKPSPSSTLVILLAKPQTLKAVHIECGKMRNPDLIKWVKASVEERGARIDEDALLELVQRHGAISQLEREVEKLCSYSKNITVDEVINLTQDKSTRKTFELASLVARLDTQNSLYTLYKLIDQGEPIQMILASLAWQFRKLIELSRRMKEGGNPQQSAMALGIKFNAWEFINAVKGISLEEIEKKHRFILEADILLKTTQINELAVMDNLIVKLSRP